MKRYKIIFQILFLAVSVSLTSCDSFFKIYPESELIQEDFWQEESDVLAVVGACYRGMNEAAFMERVIAWGEMRSDNTVAGSNPTSDVTDILELTLTSKNAYSKWGDFYKVINYCNNVLYYAPGVLELDENFSESQLKAFEAEAVGIRALCYFILVRTFRDIPYVTTPTLDNVSIFGVKQSKPEEVVDNLITDLESVQNNAVPEWENNTEYTRGRITQKAIWALLADLYLWRAADSDSASSALDYQNCVKYCDKIIDEPTNQLELIDDQYYNDRLFTFGNSDESIFELQFETEDVNNYALHEMYGVMNGRSGYNTNLLSSYNFTKKKLFKTSDLRRRDAYCPVLSGSLYPIEKYVGIRSQTSSSTAKASDYFVNSDPAPNWIFYRLSDAILMKAEALVELNRLEEAFNMVTLTYDRANPDAQGSLKIADYSTQSLMRNLVFDERQREFLFEGKRYYDLLRRIRREGTTTNVVTKYMLAKYAGLDEATAKSKLNDINALYMPINADELKLNRELQQNEFYKKSSDIVEQ